MIKTKIKIQDAFVKLLYEKPFDKITIKDITDECEMNRNTFYYHYEDIHSLVEDIIKKDFAAIGEHASHMDGFKNQCEYVVDWFIKYKTPILNIYHSFDKRYVDKHAYLMAKTITNEFVEAGYVKRGITAVQKRTLIDYYTALCYGYILMILDHDIPKDLKTQFENLFNLMGPIVDYSVETIVEKK